MEENACPIDILVDLSIPDPVENLKNTTDFDKENNDPIEISRSDDSDRRLSITLEKPLVLEDRILKDVTKNTVGNAERKDLNDSTEIQLLDEETFDFDLVLSPQEKKDEEDGDEEVFFGPVGFTEQIVAATVAEDEVKPMSPLNPAQIAEMVKEAHLVACQISSMKHDSSSDDGKSPPKRSLFSPNGKCHVRSGTFRLNEAEIKKQPEKVRRSIPCIDFSVDNDENVPMNSRLVPPLERQVEDHTTYSEKKLSDEENHNKLTQNAETKEKKPSRLTKLSKNRSFTLLKKAPNKETKEATETMERVRHKSSSSDTASETCSVTSDGCDVSFTKPKSQMRRSLQNTLKAPVARSSQGSKLQAPSGLKRSNSLVKSRPNSLLTAKNIQKASPVVSGAASNGHKRTHSNSSNSSVGSTTSNKSLSQLPQPSMGKTGLPLTKLQLMQPGKLQKNSLAFNRSKLSEASAKKTTGPMKAVVPPEERANNRMRTRGTPVKPDKMVQPKNLTSSFTTPVKSGQNVFQD